MGEVNDVLDMIQQMTGPSDFDTKLNTEMLIKSRDSVIGELDPDMRKCHECEIYFDVKEVRLLPVRSDIDGHILHKVCQTCFDESRVPGGKNYGISE